MFANLIELRERSLAGHSRRVADHARTLAKRLNLSDGEVKDVFVAGLLHDIGKIGLPDKLLAKPFVVLAGEERDLVLRHPAIGQAALMGLEQLHGAAKLIRAHHERWDGMGFPTACPDWPSPWAHASWPWPTITMGCRSARTQQTADPERGHRLYHRGPWQALRPPGGGCLHPHDGRTGKRRRGRNRDQIAAAQSRDGPVARPDDMRESCCCHVIIVLTEVIIEQIHNFERSSGRAMTIYIHTKKGE